MKTDISHKNEGVIRPLKPDVKMMLDMFEQMGIPHLETLSAAEARGLSEAMSAQSPPGPDVGEVIDGAMPGPVCELEYRLYRPSTAGPHPIVIYFHGGGWVLGNAKSDEPFCRELCVSSDSIVMSVNYRHAPEHRFPAPVDDAVSAVNWVTHHAAVLGGIPGQVAVGGWSAGANLAAVVCQLARDAGGPKIAGQLLIAPATDGTTVRLSRIENAEGFLLTTSLLDWFWDNYCDVSNRTDPRASPLLARNLSALPAAIVVTCEFDPLRDEGKAYSDALTAAGVPTQYITCLGQTHTSIMAVGAIASASGARAEIAAAVRSFFKK